MKAIVVAGVSLAVVVGVLVYEESRISALKGQLADLKEQASAKPRRVAESRPAGRLVPAQAGAERSKSARAGSRPGAVVNREGGEQVAPGDGDLAETFRKMMESPVGAAMLKEENKGRAIALYGEYLDALNLKKEERDYFVGLLAAGVNEEETIGMKLFGAKSDEERVALLDQMEADQAGRRQAIREFLNNDDDFAQYEYIEERKEIYEQMPGLRAAMDAAGASLSGEQENQVVDAIYQASVNSGMQENWDGRAGMEQFAKPNVTARFKDQWNEMQGVLDPNVATILEKPEQQAAFREHQNQVANMITFGLQFAEGMITGQGQNQDAPAPGAPAAGDQE